MSQPTFSSTSIPDEKPSISTGADGDFDPAYPGSTPDAPYGYFTEGPNAGQPRKRRPKGSGGSKSNSTGNRRVANNEASATAAANMLARMNSLIGLGIASFGMPLTASAILDANEQFEIMAREALSTDPALCRRILSGGMSSSKAGLIMAYGAVGVAMLPAAQSEIRAKREARASEMENDYATA